MKKYYISGGRDNWSITRAKSLTGAMRIATKTYQACVGGLIEVGVDYGDGCIYRSAIKRGYDKWQRDE